MNWYDLPKYYDVSFSHEMQDELRFLKSIFNLAGCKNQVRLLEPACGSGRLIVPLARDGFDCAGFDLNPAALDYLKKNCTGSIFQQTSSKLTWPGFPCRGGQDLMEPFAR